jgi:hypothetical protein
MWMLAVASDIAGSNLVPAGRNRLSPNREWAVAGRSHDLGPLAEESPQFLSWVRELSP